MNDKKIKEMAKDIDYAITKECKLNCVGHCNDCKFNVPENDGIHCQTYLVSEILCKQNYRKIPKNAVVLSRENIEKYAKDCIVGQETGLDIINALIARAEDKAERERKKTAREIYKKGKEYDDNFDMTGLGEYIIANFLTDENGVGLGE